MSIFFYRVEGLSLVPGNKAAGFDFVIDPKAFLQLSQFEFSAEQRDRLIEDARKRVLNAKLLSKKLADGLLIGYHRSSAVPRYFVADRAFGGSLGADPETFAHLESTDVLEWLGPEVRFTPHNVDSPAMALALLVLAQTWAEYANAVLEVGKWRDRAAN